MLGNNVIQAQYTSYWDGTDTTAWVNGNGSKGMPYLIETAGNLACLAHRVNTGNAYTGVYFKLMVNVNMGAADWLPIGNSTSQYFSGNFDGNDYSIDSIRITKVAGSNSYAGLFGVVQDATIENVYLTNININHTSVSATLYTGGIVGYTLDGITLKNCHVSSGRVYSLSNTASKCYTGGLVGYARFGSKNMNVEECSNGSSVYSNYILGGVVGLFNVSTTDYDTMRLISCANNGLVFGLPSTGSVYVGGLVGWLNLARNNTEVIINGCHNTAYVKDSTSEGANAYSGGIIGFIQGTSAAISGVKAYISNTWNSGKVENVNSSLDVSTNKWSYAAGITGNTTLYGIASVYYSNVYNTGEVSFMRRSPKMTSAVGGVIGIMSTQQSGGYLSLQGTYNTGNITLTSPDTANILTYAGGIIGWLSNSGGQYMIKECLNTGNINNESYYSGGIIGYTGGFYTTGNVISDCFNSGNIHSKNTAGGITACYVHKVSGNSITNCISVGSITADMGGASGISGTLGDSTILDVATCCFDRQITGVSRSASPIGIGSGLLNDTIRYARQIAALFLDTNYWYMESGMYPRLKSFQETDAMILAATPVFFYADPVAGSFNTYRKINKSFGMGGGPGTYFHSDKPNVISIINNDSAVVNASANDSVKLTVAYGTQIRKINLRIIKEQEIFTSVCQGEIYTFLGRNINTSVPGDFIYYGVDSIIYVTVHPSYQYTDTLHLCANELPLTYGDSVFVAGTLTGTYPVHFTLPSGCDSLINVHLIINPTYNHTETLTICDNDLPFVYGNQVFNNSTVSGDYPVHFTMPSGCDSLVTLHLIVNPTYNQNQTLTICSNELPITYGDSVFPVGTISGIYPVHFTSVKGCDSLVNLRLIVQPAYVTAETLTLCDNELPLYYGDSVFMIGTVSGTYPVHYTLASGCDSLVTLHLNIYPSYFSVDNISICSSDLPLTYGDTVFYPGTSSSTYYLSYTTSMGCDSLITLNLQVNPAYYFMDTVSLCDCDFPYTYMDTTFLEGTLDGDYVFNHTTSNGCDSIYSLTLYIHSTYSYTENATICAYDAYYWHGKTYNQTGVYYDSLKTKHSDCDSVFRLNLTVNDIYVTLDTITFCSNELPLEYQGKFIDRPGDYYISFTANNGCDSLVSLNVKLNQAYDTIVVAHVTKTKLPYVFGSQLLTDAGTYSELFKSVEFCDSLVHLVLVVGDLEKDTVYGNDSKKICASDLPYTYGSRIFPEGTKSGAYDIAFTTLEGKDSILNLYLTVLSIPSMPDSIIGLDKINVSGKYAYSVNPVGGADQYRWGISNSMFVFEDETNTSNNTVLYVALSGDAILSVAAGNQCGYSADKSMQILSSVSIADSYKDAFNVKIYPNPVQDNVYIDIEGENAIDEITLIDVYGKTVGRLHVSDSHLQWDVSALANGIYFLQFKAGKEIIGSYKIIRHK